MKRWWRSSGGRKISGYKRNCKARGEMQTLDRDGEIFFFVVNGQGVERNLEGCQGDIGRAAYQFKINRILALYAFGE
jgi:hypothetical protein